MQNICVLCVTLLGLSDEKKEKKKKLLIDILSRQLTNVREFGLLNSGFFKNLKGDER